MAWLLLGRQGTMRTRPRANGVRPHSGWLRRQGTRLGIAVGRRARSAGTALSAGVAALASRVAYRRQEVAVVALLAASLVGGAGVDAWRRHDPGMLARLEEEPPRLTAPTRGAARRDPGARDARRHNRGPRDPEGHGSRPRRSTCPDCRRAPIRHLVPPAPPAPTAETPLDLNRATVADLVRLPGIGPRLAQRILQHRETLGGHFDAAGDLAAIPGLGRQRAARIGPLVTVPPSPGAPDSSAETRPELP